MLALGTQWERLAGADDQFEGRNARAVTQVAGIRADFTFDQNATAGNCRGDGSADSQAKFVDGFVAA